PANQYAIVGSLRSVAVGRFHGRFNRHLRETRLPVLRRCVRGRRRQAVPPRERLERLRPCGGLGPFHLSPTLTVWRSLAVVPSNRPPKTRGVACGTPFAATPSFDS